MSSTNYFINPDMNFTQFQIKVTVKHFFADTPYNLQLTNESIHIYRDNLPPKYVLWLNLNSNINFIVNTSKFNIIAFSISHKNKEKIFYGDSEQLAKFKQLLSTNVIKSQIQDFYEPLHELGKGSSGRVIYVKDKKNKSVYASKCIDKTYLSKSQNGLANLFQEIRIMKILENHINFIKIEEVFQGDQGYYIIMEQIDGRTLKEEFENLFQNYNDKNLYFSIIRKIMKQLLEAIHHMHTKGYMHRDIKPDNIMFSQKNLLSNIKLIDFGLAQQINSQSFTHYKCGTPGYVAPEVINSSNQYQTYSEKCDIFSLGSVFYKLATKKSLFPGNSFQSVLQSNKNCSIDFVSFKNILPTSVYDLLKHMLDIDPNQRISAKQALKHCFFDKSAPLIFKPLVNKQKVYDFETRPRNMSIDAPFAQTNLNDYQISENQEFDSNQQQKQQIVTDINKNEKQFTHENRPRVRTEANRTETAEEDKDIGFNSLKQIPCLKKPEEIIRK